MTKAITALVRLLRTQGIGKTAQNAIAAQIGVAANLGKSEFALAVGKYLAKQATSFWTLAPILAAYAPDIYSQLMEEPSVKRNAELIGRLEKVKALPALSSKPDEVMGDHKPGIAGMEDETLLTGAQDIKTAIDNIDWIASVLGVPGSMVVELSYRLQAIEPEHRQYYAAFNS
jgi:hypothetical protein